MSGMVTEVATSGSNNGAVRADRSQLKYLRIVALHSLQLFKRLSVRSGHLGDGLFRTRGCHFSTEGIFGAIHPPELLIEDPRS
jgi:hypothetical protein